MKLSMKIMLVVFSVVSQTCLSQTDFWQATSGPPGTTYSLVRDSGGTVVAGCNSATFFSTDNGGQWISGSGLPNAAYFSMTQSVSRSIFSGTTGGYVFRSTDIGATWTVANTGWIAVGVFALTSNSAGHIFATNSGVFRTTNEGASWSGGILPDFAMPYSIIIDSAGVIYTGTYNHGIFKSFDNGSSWTPCGGNFANTIVRSFLIDDRGGIFTCANQNVFYSSDHGATWEMRSSGLPNSPIFAMVMNKSKHIYVSTNDGGVYRSKNKARNWSNVGTGLTTLTCWSLITEPSGFLQVGTTAGVFRSRQSTTLLSLPRDSILFDTVRVGQSMADSVLVRNMGTETLSISSTQSSISDFTVTPHSVTMPAGSEMWFHITFSPGSFGPIEGSIVFTSNANTSPDEVYLSGIGKGAFLQFSTKEVSVGTVSVGTFRDTTFLLHNAGNDTLQIVDILSSQPVFTVHRGRSWLAPGDSTTDSIRFAPVHNGEIAGLLIYQSNATSSPDTVRVAGVGDTTTAVMEQTDELLQFRLHQNFPNPFNSSTVIRFDIPRDGFVTLQVFNLVGEEVASVLNKTISQGEHSVVWNAEGFPSGVFFYRMRCGSFVETKKLMLIR